MKIFALMAALGLAATGFCAEQPTDGCADGGFSIEGEFLWWRAQMDNLDYALNAGSTISIAPPIVFSARTREPDFSFDPGVRASIGYDFGQNNWDVFLRWTYHYTSVADNTGSTAIPAGLISTKDFLSQNGIPALSFSSTGKAKWQNRLNMIDFEMGYDYCVGNRFSLRPFMGVKGAWLDMDYRTTYRTVTSPAGTFSNVHVTQDMDFWGVGPMVGIEGFLHMGWGFSIYSQSSAAFIYGEYDSRYKQTTSAGGRIVVNHDNFTRQRAIGAIAIGLEWARCFANRYLLSLHVGWEGQYFWNQYEFRFVDEFVYHGDLTYTGLDAGIRFDF